METEFVIPVYNYLDKQLDKLYEDIYSDNCSPFSFKRRRSKGRTLQNENVWSKSKEAGQNRTKLDSEKPVNFSNAQNESSIKSSLNYNELRNLSERIPFQNCLPETSLTLTHQKHYNKETQDEGITNSDNYHDTGIKPLDTINSHNTTNFSCYVVQQNEDVEFSTKEKYLKGKLYISDNCDSKRTHSLYTKQYTGDIHEPFKRNVDDCCSMEKTGPRLEDVDNVDKSEGVIDNDTVVTLTFEKLFTDIQHQQILNFNRKARPRTCRNLQLSSIKDTSNTVDKEEETYTEIPIILDGEGDSDSDSDKSGIIPTYQRKNTDQETEQNKRKVEKEYKQKKHSRHSHRDSGKNVNIRGEIQDHKKALKHRKSSHLDTSEHKGRHEEDSRGRKFRNRISVPKKSEKEANSQFDHRSNKKSSKCIQKYDKKIQKTKTDCKNKDRNQKYYHRGHREHGLRKDRDKYSINITRDMLQFDKSKHKNKSDKYHDKRHRTKDSRNRKSKSDNENKENRRNIRIENKERCDTNVKVDTNNKCEANCDPKCNVKNDAKNAWYRNYRSEKHMRTRGVVRIIQEKQKRAKELITIEQKVQDQIFQNHETHAGVKYNVYDCLEDFDDRVDLIDDIENALPKSHVTEWSNGERQYNLNKNNQLEQVFHNGGLWKSITQEKV